MARIKVIPVGKIIFQATIPIRITDINYSGHVGNDTFAGIVHDARTQWLRSLGYTELDAAGVGLIMSGLIINYKKQSYYGDVLHVQLQALPMNNKSFELYYTLTRQNEDGGADVVALAQTDIVCFNFKTNTIATITPPLLQAIT